MRSINETDWKEYCVGTEFLPVDHQWFKTESEYFTLKHNFSLEPIEILTSKGDELSFRIFKFVDKINLFKQMQHIEKNISAISSFIEKVDDENKVSQFSIFGANKEGKLILSNLIELKSIGKFTNAKFIDNVRKELSRSSRYKNVAHIDIARFYDSIYTHSVEWVDDSKIKKIADELDKKMRGINGLMTSGIPTGPITSKIFSEIIMSEIMLKISREIKNIDVHIHRFADDFSIYYDDDGEYKNTLKKIAIIFSKYKLFINKEKYLANYTFSNKTFNKIATYSQDEMWTVFSDEMLASINATVKQAALKVEKLILSKLSTLTSNKEKLSFYKYMLKTSNNDKFWKLIKNNSNLAEMFFNFSIKFIVQSDVGLNIPLNFLNRLILATKKDKRKEYREILLSFYRKTDSEIKKIFLFELLIKQEWVKVKNSDIISMTQDYYRNEWFLHISQLLESKLIDFSNIENVKLPSYKFRRLGKEWILWIYADDKEINKIGDATIKNKILEAKKYLSFIKPFHY